MDIKAFKEEISHKLPKKVVEDKEKIEKAVKYARKKDIKVYNHTFMESTKIIYQRESLKGYMHGFTPSMMKNKLNSGTYFSVLFYFENLFR